MYGIINNENIIITVCANRISSEGMQTVEFTDENITVGWQLKEDGTFTKSENLIKEEKIQEFKNLKQQIIDEENNEKIKQILGIEEKPTKSSESPLDALKTQINNLYNDLVKTYGEDITNLLF